MAGIPLHIPPGSTRVTMKQAWKPILVSVLCLGIVTLAVLAWEALFA